MPGGFPLGLDICNGTDVGTVTGSSTGTSITGGSQAYGSYTQLIASTAADACFMLVSITPGSANSGSGEGVKIAVGAAASEVVIASDLQATYFSGTSSYTAYYLFPVNIPSGTRIAAAVANAASNTTDTALVQVTLFDGAFTQLEGCAGVDSIGAGGGGSFGSQITASGSTNTKGSYTQLTSSTSRDYTGLIVHPGAYTNGTITASAAYLIDIAIGGAGSEQVIIPNLMVTTSNQLSLNDVRGPFPILIPSGTRVAARSQASVASANIGLTLYGIYQ